MKSTFIKMSLCSFLLSMVSHQAFAGSYSAKCDDYQTSGFTSKDACLKDGRWHVVYENDTRGTATYGSVDILQGHISEGADVKVIAPNQRLYLNGSYLNIMANLNEKCQQVYRSQSGVRPIYCLTSLRFGNEEPTSVNHGSARYGTDGKVFCNAMNVPGSNGCVMDPVVLKWMIKY